MITDEYPLCWAGVGLAVFLIVAGFSYFVIQSYEGQYEFFDGEVVVYIDSSPHQGCASWSGPDNSTITVKITHMREPSENENTRVEETVFQSSTNTSGEECFKRLWENARLHVKLDDSEWEIKRVLNGLGL